MIIDNIRTQFIEEARHSPILLADLASMESYISESYSGRSLIELLQNADDAGASTFYVEIVSNNALIIANNGRPFNENDLLSLCRSGSSTKKRKGNTIGFRGIGFKSVINYSEEVYLFSGDYKIKFSKVLTQSALKTNVNVPLIRIPHNVEQAFYNERVNNLYKQFNTVFLFKIKNSSFIDELEEFHNSCMLFLRNIEQINVSGIKSYHFSAKRTNLSNNQCLVALHNNDNLEKDEWLIIKNSNSQSYSSIAFKLLDNVAIPAKANESIIHSFMPTREKLSFPAKLNGDFSTDPSRTKIVYDEETYTAINECVEPAVSYIKQALSSNEDIYNILNILCNATVDPLSNIRGKTVNDIFVTQLKEQVQKNLRDKPFLRPDFLAETDYIKVCNNMGYSYFMDSEKNSSLTKFLKTMAIPYLSLIDTLSVSRSIEFSQSTRLAVIAETIKESRFGANKQLLDNFSTAKLFATNYGVTDISHIKSFDDIVKEFLETLISRVGSFKDVENLFKKFGIVTVTTNEQQAKIATKISTIKQKQFSKQEVIPKWRSVEKNVAAVLQGLKGVSTVRDVSEQNLGYDLEVVLDSGEKQYIEVKSVSSLGDSISITNNEYSTANQYQKLFYLAITCQTDDSIEICLINDPIYTLSLTKRVVRWEWVCNQYNGQVIKKEFE